MGTSRGQHIQDMFAMVQAGKLNPGVALGPAFRMAHFRQGLEEVAARTAIGEIIVSGGGGGGKLVG